MKHTKYLLGLITVCLAAVQGKAQNYSNLQNAELRKVPRANVIPLTNQVIGGLFEKLKKKEDRVNAADEGVLVNISKLTVVSDDRNRLLLKVNYTPVVSNPVLHCVLVNKTGEPINTFTLDSVRTGSSGELNFTINLKQSAAPSGKDAEFFSDYVLLKTYNAEKKNFGEAYYQLNKRWISGTKTMKILVPANDALTRLARNENIDNINNNRVKTFTMINYATLSPALYSIPAKTTGVKEPVKTMPAKKDTAKNLYLSNVFIATPMLFYLDSSKIKPVNPVSQPERTERVILDMTSEMEMFTDEGFPDIAYQLTNIKLNYIVQTKNKGEFFYIPNSFNIKWTANDGYDMNMTYAAQSDPVAGTGNVRIRGTLTPNISREEVKLVESFLKLYCRKKAISFVSFKEFPAENYSNTLAKSLQATFDVNESNVIQTSANSLREEISFTWRVSSAVKDEIEAALVSGGGITAQMSFSEPPPNDTKQYTIRVQIKLDDPGVLGRMELDKTVWRSARWKNATSFPLKLKAVHFLDLASNTEKINVYSCRLNNENIQPGDEVEFDGRNIPVSQDRKFNRIWLEYDVEKCEPCYGAAIQKLTGGVSSSAQEISFQGIGCFEIDSIRANQLMVEVRSKQLDPQGTTVTTAPTIKLTEAENEKKLKPLYVPKNAEPDFEYRISFVTTDGDVKQSGWIKSNTANIIIGKKLVKDNCFR
jgi:hypothetical protein